METATSRQRDQPGMACFTKHDIPDTTVQIATDNFLPEGLPGAKLFHDVTVKEASLMRD